MKLTNFEQQLVEFILTNERPLYLEHVRLLQVREKELTGIGLNVYFKYNKNSLRTFNENLTLGTSVFIDLPGLNDGAGTMLYIDGGLITALELFSHTTETWPSEIDRFSFKYLV